MTPAQWTDKSGARSRAIGRTWRATGASRSPCNGPPPPSRSGRSSKAAGGSEGALSARSLLSLVSPNVTATALPVLPKLNNGEPSALRVRSPPRRRRARRAALLADAHAVERQDGAPATPIWLGSLVHERLRRPSWPFNVLRRPSGRTDDPEPARSPWHDIEDCASTSCEGVRVALIASRRNRSGSRRAPQHATARTARAATMKISSGAQARKSRGVQQVIQVTPAAITAGRRGRVRECPSHAVGVPVPAVPVLVLAARRSRNGTLSFTHVLFAAVFAALIGDGVWFTAGRTYGRPPHQPARPLLALDRLQRADDARAFERFGAPIMAMCKFVPGLALITPPLMGTTRIEVKLYAIWDTIGMSAWASFWLLGGALFSRQLARSAHTVEQHGATVVDVLVALRAPLSRVSIRAALAPAPMARSPDHLGGNSSTGMMRSGAPPVRARRASRDRRQPGAVPDSRRLAARPERPGDRATGAPGARDRRRIACVRTT